MLYSNFLQAACFTHGSELNWVYICQNRSRFAPPSPSPPASTSLFSMSVSLFLPWKWVHLYQFYKWMDKAAMVYIYIHIEWNIISYILNFLIPHFLIFMCESYSLSYQCCGTDQGKRRELHAQCGSHREKANLSTCVSCPWMCSLGILLVWGFVLYSQVWPNGDMTTKCTVYLGWDSGTGKRHEVKTK